MDLNVTYYILPVSTLCHSVNNDHPAPEDSGGAAQMTRQLEEEKAALLERKRQEQAERRRKQEELDRILLDNRRKVCCTAISALGGTRALTGPMVDRVRLCLRMPEPV